MATPKDNAPRLVRPYTLYIERKASGDELSSLCNRLVPVEQIYPRDVKVRTPERPRVATTRVNVIHPFYDIDALDQLTQIHTRASASRLLARKVPSLTETRSVRLVGLRDPAEIPGKLGDTIFNLMLEKADAEAVAQEQAETWAVIESEVGSDELIRSKSSQTDLHTDIRILWASTHVHPRHIDVLRKVTEDALTEGMSVILAEAVVPPQHI